MFKTVMHKTQEDLILEHLKAEGSISGVEAQALYKIRSLPRRIATLRDRGYNIQSIRCKDHCGQRYVRYRYMKPSSVQQQLELPNV